MSAPDEWDIGVVWLSRRLHRPDRMLRSRIGATRRKSDDRPSDAGSRVVDGLSGLGDFGDTWVTLAVVAFVILVVVLVVIGPGLLALTIGLAEILVLMAISVVAVIVRFVFRRPWEVLARSDSRQLGWRAESYRGARDLVAEIESAVAHGFDPADVALDRRDHDIPPALEAAPSMYGAMEFRWLGRAFGVASAVAIFAAALILLLG